MTGTSAAVHSHRLASAYRDIGLYRTTGRKVVYARISILLCPEICRNLRMRLRLLRRGRRSRLPSQMRKS